MSLLLPSSFFFLHGFSFHFARVSWPLYTVLLTSYIAFFLSILPVVSECQTINLTHSSDRRESRSSSQESKGKEKFMNLRLGSAWSLFWYSATNSTFIGHSCCKINIVIGIHIVGVSSKNKTCDNTTANCWSVAENCKVVNDVSPL